MSDDTFFRLALSAGALLNLIVFFSAAAARRESTRAIGFAISTFMTIALLWAGFEWLEWRVSHKL